MVKCGPQTKQNKFQQRQRDSTGGKALLLHVVNLVWIPRTAYVPAEHQPLGEYLLSTTPVPLLPVSIPKSQQVLDRKNSLTGQTHGGLSSSHGSYPALQHPKTQLGVDPSPPRNSPQAKQNRAISTGFFEILEKLFQKYIRKPRHI